MRRNFFYSLQINKRNRDIVDVSGCVNRACNNARINLFFFDFPVEETLCSFTAYGFTCNNRRDIIAFRAVKNCSVTRYRSPYMICHFCWQLSIRRYVPCANILARVCKVCFARYGESVNVHTYIHTFTHTSM